MNLKKAALLESLLQLPYNFVMPNTLLDDECLCLSEAEKQALSDKGLEVRDLPGSAVQRAARYFNQHSCLKLNDCFALSLAEDIEKCIFLTGDGPLGCIAQDKAIEVRDTLWAIDELESHQVLSHRGLHDALQFLLRDDFVFLPADDVTRRIRRLARLL